MARIKSRKSRARHFTPPPNLVYSGHAHPKTPSRSGVLWARAFAQKLGIQISQEIVREVTGIPERVQSRILTSKQARTLYNQEEAGPDPRGRKRVFKRSETAAVSSYLDNLTVSLDNKGKPWQDVIEDAGVILPQPTHFKPPGVRLMTPKSI
jgi:hypothetical protein